MRAARVVALAAACGLAAGAGDAHEVRATVLRVEATLVTLRYADGTPFAGEDFELLAAGAPQVLMAGRTDAHGRAVLLLEGPGPWRLRSHSADGHGIEQPIVPPAGHVPAEAAAGGPQGGHRFAPAVSVLGGLLALSALLGLFAGLPRLHRAWRRRRAR